MKGFEEIIIDQTKTATKIPQSDYLENGKYRIFDQGKEYSVGFSNDENGVVTDFPYIIFGDHTRVVKFVNEPCFIGADGVKLLKVVNKDFDSKYIYYNILAKPIENQGYARHFKFVKEIMFTEKSLPEQQKIVAHLDLIQSAIDNKKQQLQQLDELVKSKFVEMFGDPVENEKGWECKNLGTLGSFKNGLNFSQTENGTEVKYLGVADFKKNFSITNNDLGTVFSNVVPSNEYYLKNNDIVFVRSNGNKELVGRCVVVYPNSEKIIFSGFCIRFRPAENKDLNVIYLASALKTESLKAKTVGRGANVQNLNQKILTDLSIPLPPIELQNDFATFVQKIDSAKSIIKTQLADLQELLDSKMDEYFGE